MEKRVPGGDSSPGTRLRHDNGLPDGSLSAVTDPMIELSWIKQINRAMALGTAWQCVRLDSSGHPTRTPAFPHRVIFSVSVPIKGQSHFLRAALESLRCQSNRVEVAALDASPDDSVQEVLRDYEDLVSYGYHRGDEGQAAAIQEGWDNTRGEIVAWLNADDCYFPGSLARVGAVFESRPDVDVVFGHAVNLDAGGAFLSYFPAAPDNVSLIRTENGICQPACFVRRSAMERVGGLSTSLHYVMDWDFWVRLYNNGSRFHFLATPLAAVTQHPQTKTLSGAALRYQEIGDLLALSAPRAERMLSLARIRCHDILNRPPQGAAALLRPLALVAASLDWRLRKPREQPVLFGIEVGTQRVSGECIVQFPRYAPGHPASALIVLADVPVTLHAEIAGTSLVLEPRGTEVAHFAGREITAQVIGGELPVPLGTPDVSIRLRGNPGWRLIAARLSA